MGVRQWLYRGKRQVGDNHGATIDKKYALAKLAILAGASIGMKLAPGCVLAEESSEEGRTKQPRRSRVPA
jgi:hypothetical protein